MALRVCVTALLVAVFAAVASGDTVYSTATTVAGGTFNAVIDTITPPLATPSYATQRNCLISSTNAVPFVSASAATVSVKAGYLGTAGGKTVCCAYFGHINEDKTGAVYPYGACLHNICSYTKLAEIAADYYYFGTSGTPAVTNGGMDYFFSSTSNSGSQLCLPRSECFEAGTQSFSPVVHQITNGVQSSAGDNFYSSTIGQATTSATVSTFRTTWIQFPSDYTPNLLAGSDPVYTIAKGVYSAYDVYINAHVYCQPSTYSGTGHCITTGPSGSQSKATHLACKDRGAYDGQHCTLPCGQSWTSTVVDATTLTANTYATSSPTQIPQFAYCYVNCLVLS